MKVKVRSLVEGYAEGEALVSREPISFLGDVDPKTGTIVREGHELYGESVKGKVLIFPHGRGSTVGSYIIYQMFKYGVHPKAIVNIESEEIIVVGCVLANIPLVDRPEGDILNFVRSGDWVVVDANRGYIVLGEGDG